MHSATTESRGASSRAEGWKRKFGRISWADHQGKPLARPCPIKSEVQEGKAGPQPYPQSIGGPPPSGVQEKRRSYKEALLSSLPSTNHPQPPRSSPRCCTPSLRHGNCFRCLASNHWARDCRDPVKCLKCLGNGHLARNCRIPSTRAPRKMQGGYRLRPHAAKVFVPLTEGFHSRQQRGRRAVIAIICRRANLGHHPQGTLANDLAGRFGGLSNDFQVAKFRAHDYVIFLPQWVQPEDLVRRDGLRLTHCRIRCFTWNPLWDAVRARLRFKVWIKLMGLPYECWSEGKVSAVVNDFGRYLRADDSSRDLLDINFYKCKVAVEDPADVPENLYLTMGDLLVHIPIVLVSTASFGGDDRGIPFAGGDPNEGGGQTDPLGRQLARWTNLNVDIEDGSVSGGRRVTSDSWNSSEIRDRWRQLMPLLLGSAGGPQRADGGSGCRTSVVLLGWGAGSGSSCFEVCRNGAALQRVSSLDPCGAPVSGNFLNLPFLAATVGVMVGCEQGERSSAFTISWPKEVWFTCFGWVSSHVVGCGGGVGPKGCRGYFEVGDYRGAPSFRLTGDS